MRSFVLSTVFALSCVHCSINDEARTEPPVNGTPDPGPPVNAPKGTTASTSSGGARLKVRLFTSPDGAEFVRGIYDSTEKQTCTIALYADGAQRCVPESNEINDPVLQFGDAACETKPLGDTYPFSLSRYGHVKTRVGNTRAIKLYEATGPALPVSKTYMRNAKGECVTGFVSGQAPRDLYPLAEVPASRFVAGTIEVGSDKGGISPTTFVGSDGSRLFAGYIDSSSGNRCQVALAGDGKPRCLPLETAEAQIDLQSHFASSQCTGQAVTVFDAAQGAPTLVQSRKSSGLCGESTIQIHTVGAVVPRFYASNGAGACTEVNDGSSAALVGPPLAPTTFPAAQETAPWGTGRIRSLYYAVGNEPVSLRAQFDTQRNEGCVFNATYDGETRCVPYALSVNSGYFTDSSCSIEAIPQFDTCAGDRDPKYYVPVVGPNKGHYFSVSKVGSVPLYGKDGKGACVARSSPVATYFAVGTEVPIASFEKVTVTDR